MNIGEGSGFPDDDDNNNATAASDSGDGDDNDDDDHSEFHRSLLLAQKRRSPRNCVAVCGY